MVLIAAPPPNRPPSPLFHFLPTGGHIVRIYDPTIHGTTELTFRFFGPLARFDHHRGTHPKEDLERGVYYAAPKFSSCLVEVFGDAGVIETGHKYVCRPQLTRRFRLLDLRGSGAMKAGSVAALAKVADRSLSQTWSRYFYERQEVYSKIDGIIYYNAHNDEEAIVLYEHARNGLTCLSEQVLPLNDPSLLPFMKKVAIDNNLVFDFRA